MSKEDHKIKATEIQWLLFIYVDEYHSSPFLQRPATL